MTTTGFNDLNVGVNILETTGDLHTFVDRSLSDAWVSQTPKHALLYRSDSPLTSVSL